MTARPLTAVVPDAAGVPIPEPVRCGVCGRRFGSFPSDRLLGGGSSWTGGVCPGCVWDQDVEGAAA